MLRPILCKVPFGALLATLASLPLLGSCAAAIAGVGAGLIISRDVLPNQTVVAQVDRDVDAVWPSVKETLAILNDLEAGDVVTSEFPRTAFGRVDGASIEVAVEAYDLDRTVIRVQAENRLGASDVKSAERVLTRILERLEP